MTEALGPLNRWYCSQAYCQEIDDEELLLKYYIKSGGAVDFAKRYAEAMSPLNRWYCSQFHGHDIGDPQLLWEYYNRYAAYPGPETHTQDSFAESEWSIAS
jgi:hypothetical protein